MLGKQRPVKTATAAAEPQKAPEKDHAFQDLVRKTPETEFVTLHGLKRARTFNASGFQVRVAHSTQPLIVYVALRKNDAEPWSEARLYNEYDGTVLVRMVIRFGRRVVEHSYKLTGCDTGTELLQEAVKRLRAELQDYVRAEAAAEPQKNPEEHAIDPKAPAYFRAFVGLADLKGKSISRAGHPWHMRIESTWCPDDDTNIRRRMASAKIAFQSGDVRETISVSAEDHAEVFKVVVGGNHLGSGGRVFLELTAAELRAVTKPTQFLWVLADKLQILNSAAIPDKTSTVKIPPEYLDKAVRSYLNAFLELTTDDGHPDYNADNGDGPNLAADASIDDIDPADATKAREYMRRFLEHVYPDIAAAEYTTELNSDQVGHDAFLTAGGFGAGFLDRRYDEDLRHKLDRACDAIFPGGVDGSATRNARGEVTRVHMHF